MRLWELTANMLFTSVCHFCGDTCAYDAWICPDCAQSLAPIDGITCAVCGREEGSCTCALEKDEWERCVASFYYEGTAKQGVELLKYGKIPFIARRLSGYMAKQVKRRYKGVRFDGITYIPMYRLNRQKRGYNQAEELARELARRLALPLVRGVLTQSVQNSPQHLQNREQRRDNVAGIYRIPTRRKARIAGKTLLLVDDITTTGETLRECTRVLRAGGARAVFCAVFCTTKPTKA